MLFDENGLSLDSSIHQMKEVGESMHLKDFTKKMIDLNLPSSVFVDCTSSADVAGQYEEILSANISIVTPNKKANSGVYQNYIKLQGLAQARGVRFLYETNVGAGLPVINTLNDLLLSGRQSDSH